MEAGIARAYLSNGILIAGLGAGTHVASPAQPVVEAPTLAPVQVSATRTAKPAAEVPAAVTVLSGRALRPDSLRIALPDLLPSVPGLLARDRQNFAQDVQISIRGFGARATFGIRGVRLFVDGLPATMPDGQGQVSNINLDSAGRIEILRGPFSALYGNAAGGVIQVFTADGAEQPGLRFSTALASPASQRESLNWGGVAGELDYNLDLTHFQTAGFRRHSRASRDLFNAKGKFAVGDDGELMLVVNSISSPEAQDPLGLTAAQLAADPEQVAMAALQFNTRKALQQSSLGVSLERPVATTQTLRLLGYLGDRRVTQFLAVPVGAQGNPLNGGGVVDLASRFHGLDARWRWLTQLASRPLELVLGASIDRQQQRRRGFENFANGVLGVRGDLRRQQEDTVGNSDQYLQAEWSMAPKLKLLLGIRHSQVRFESRDRYVTASNPDDSGHARYSATSPVAGLTWRPTPTLSLYASYGHGFETPTFDELGYRPDGSAGLNFDLAAARSRSAELGAKWHNETSDLQLAWFRARTDNELAVASNSAGRSTFQNVGRAIREGLEFSWENRWSARWHSQLSLTRLHATLRDSFLTCAGGPCASPSVEVAAGAQIPGVPQSQAYASVTHDARSGWETTVRGQRVGAMTVNTLGNARSAAYAVFDLDVAYPWRNRLGAFRVFARIGNLADRRYAGSVIVNESNGRYFEPAQRRNLLLGIDWRP